MQFGIFFLAASAATGTTSRLGRRGKEEHVALCDCKNGKNVISSQMAYFVGDVGPKPEDVATIAATPNGQARVWSSTTTEALFTATNTKFTAKLGPQVDVGALAGTGDNGYLDPFNCWFRPQQKLYIYDGWTCAMVYDCSHDPVNSTVPSTPSGAPPSGPTRATNSDQQTESQGISTPALIGVAVGSGMVAIIVIGAVGFVCTHRRRARAAEKKLDEQRQRPPSRQKSLYGGVFDAEGNWHQTIKPGPLQELDGHYRGLEIHAGPTGGYREIDSTAIVAEIQGNGDSSRRLGST